MLELDKIQTDTYEFSLVLPDGEICHDAKITVRGDNHPKVKELARKLILQNEARQQAQKRRGRKPDDGLTEEDLEYLEEIGLKRMVNRVEQIKGLSEGGKEIGTDQELIATVLKKYDWLAEQIGEESKDLVNFCSTRPR